MYGSVYHCILVSQALKLYIQNFIKADKFMTNKTTNALTNSAIIIYARHGDSS